MSGKVYFIGAGPGDPELLTRKADKLLSAAQVVLHDALVAPEILSRINPNAEICDVGRRCGRKSITQEELHALMIRHARGGRMVVRLQGGDALIFGRAGEEMAALREAGIEFEIVPGVTAASAAAAAAQISLTNRAMASKLIFLSGHRRPGAASSNWADLPASDATLVIYMPGRNYDEIAQKLQATGWVRNTPCLIVSNASTGNQLVRRTDLGALTDAAEIPAPALLIVGEVTRAETRELAAALPALSRSNK